MTIDRFDEAAEGLLMPSEDADERLYASWLEQNLYEDLPTDEMLVNWREAAEYDHEGDFEFDGSWEDDA